MSSTYPIQMDDYEHDGKLIIDEAKSLDAAWGKPILLFRWRSRICVTCLKKFDISQEGRFYQCGECAK